MPEPLISIVMSTFNGEKFLEEQIVSILRQTYKNIELIISDDHSSDGTRSILQKYENDQRCRIFYQEKNIGLAKNFIFTAQQANGELIAFADQDDVWLENKIQVLHDHINGHDLVYSNSLLVDEHGKSMNRTLADLKKMYSGKDARSYVLYTFVWGHSMMIRKHLLERSLPLPENVHHDDWLAFKALTSGGIHYVDEVLTHYRRHDTTTTLTLPEKQKARKKDKRRSDHEKKMHWLSLMQEHDIDEHKSFYEELIALYKMKETGSYVPQLVSFMLKHRDVLFRSSHKKIFSQLIEILKEARGEKI